MATKTKLTTKDRLHKLVDALDDIRAEALLMLLDEARAQEAQLAAAKPITADDPLFKLVDLIDPSIEVPSDVSTNKYKYIADAIESEWKG